MTDEEFDSDAVVTLEQGAGGKAMRDLVSEVLTAGLPDDSLDIGREAMDDGAVVPIGDRNVVFTTDSHVVHPPFFPGGDIGRLAVSGTVNDLAVMGATDVRALSSAVVVEAGYAESDLERIADSMARTCREADAAIVTGDTKVMGHGDLDGIVVNTTGVGVADHVVGDDGLSPDDVLVSTGEVGRHGVALLAEREGIDFGTTVESDVRPINGVVDRALSVAGADITAMKDPTRMGLAGAASEMATKGGVGIELRQDRIPVPSDVKGASEMLGLNPLQIANEGIALLGVRPTAAADVLAALRSHPDGQDAAAIGKAIDDEHGRVLLDTGLGTRYLREPATEPAPRIC
ncbi:hydrogenase expression/formation protein HypE [Haloplanus rallus]|jgi:hydrogenase expression/formation protein HypE|uniref:Hydrogenase expression/formation protein HypE n=1 Tax=Haloplanus rallus TaxID=1816183 RepID=A0A6B9FCM5_9EURY|nr:MULTISPECIES: hydrogenase expression/formation protein HypE [Haloplanus]QGX93960.1 hydrogenase expression/formation protein HypE [Haloplanus rallus]